MKRKQFLVFEIRFHEASGGLDDCTESFDTLDEAMVCGKESLYPLVEIYDRINDILTIL